MKYRYTEEYIKNLCGVPEDDDDFYNNSWIRKTIELEDCLYLLNQAYKEGYKDGKNDR